MWLLSSRMGRAPRGQRASVLQLPARTRGITVVDRRLVEAAHANGLQVHVWTVNEPGEMAALLDVGVDGIITDRPDLLKELLLARGQWR
jgi:glycerophosphoryl diester phosphodiesterase